MAFPIYDSCLLWREEMEKKGGENMTVQTVQNAGITGTGKDNRQSAAARDTFMEMLNTHLNQASDRKNANAGPGKAASQPGQKSGEPVKKKKTQPEKHRGIRRIRPGMP